VTIQFRSEADERRYLALRSEIVMRLMQCPIDIAHEILRNIGKLESFVHAEGVRQGTVATLLALGGDVATLLTMTDSSGDTPLGIHARVYAGASTPLVRAERGFLEARGADADALLSNPVFDASPTKFAPTTLAEAIAEYGPTLIPTGTPKRARAVVSTPEPDLTDNVPSDTTLAEGTLTDEQIDALLGVDAPIAMVDHDQVLQAIESGDMDQAEALLSGKGTMPFAAPEQDDIPPESPDALDRIRDQLHALLRSGEWEPTTWDEVTRQLHITMGWDSSFIDLQLSRPMGMAMLAQVGLLAPATFAEAIARFEPAHDPARCRAGAGARVRMPTGTPERESAVVSDLTDNVPTDTALAEGTLTDEQIEAILGIDTPNAEALLSSKGTMPFAAPEQDDIPPESPDALDRIRDQLHALLRGGEWKPTAWGEVIYQLHVTMGWDASFLDLQLSGPMGMTVLAQVGLLNIQPGVGAIFTPEGRLEAKV
jgi:hypothetical protein